MENNANWKELKKELLKDENFRQEYYRPDLAFEIGEMVIDARVKLGLTQVELAKLAGTQQSSIARLENGDTPPSLSFLEKLATSMGTYLIGPKFAFLEKDTEQEVHEIVPETVTWMRPFSSTASNAWHTAHVGTLIESGVSGFVMCTGPQAGDAVHDVATPKDEFVTPNILSLQKQYV